MVDYQTKTYGQKNKKVVIVFGGLGSTQKLFWFLGKALSSHGYKAIIYTYSPALLSPDPKKTRMNFTNLVQEVQKTLRSLPKRQQKRIAVFGTSLGSVPAMMLVQRERNIRDIILNTPIANVAETVWKWEKHHFNFKKQLQEHRVTRKKLRSDWFDLSPINNLDTLADKRLLLFASTHDEIIPYTQTKELVKKLEDEEIEFEAIINSRHKHLLSSIISMLRYQTYISFLDRGNKK